MSSLSEEESIQGDAQGSNAQEEKIFVSVRLRPLNEREISKNDASDWKCVNDSTIMYKNILQERSTFPSALTFDRVFGYESSTRQVYEEAAKKVAFSVVSGINSSIFAYGQTSSGKTYTMTGVTEYAISDIYDYIEKNQERQFVLKFSAMEIYNECVRDLLTSDPTQLRLLDDPERGTVVEKLTEVTLRDFDHLKELLAVCEAQRQIGETTLNEMSSRSHQILRLTVESSARQILGAKNASTLAATVDFVDLAGSERASQAMTASTRLKEGCHINRSLLTLGTVIRKLSKGRNGHVPYRDSKLTRILQNSLGGNARTAIICTVSPAHSHLEQTRNTLFFASCAKQVSTNAQVNVVMSEKELVKQLQRELARLENELRILRSLSSSNDSGSALKEKELLIEKMDKEMRDLVQQRDHLQDMLYTGSEHERSRSWAEMSNFSEFHENGPRLDDNPASEVSETVDPLLSDVASNISPFSDRDKGVNSNKGNIQLSETEEQFLSDDTSPTAFIDKYFGPDPSRGWEKMAHATDQNIEDICKDVRCIDIDVDNNAMSTDGLSAQVKGSRDSEPIPQGDNDGTLKQNDQDSKETTDYPVDSPPKEQHFSTSSDSDSSDSKNIDISMSRTRKPIPRTASLPPRSEKEIPGSFKVEQDVNDLDRSDKQLDGTEGRMKISSNAYINDENSCGPEVHGNDKPIFKKQLEDDKVLKVQPIPKPMSSKLEDFYEDSLKSTDKPKRSASEDGMKAAEDPQQSPLDRVAEFERQRKEIIELWEACNVTLVHRTYFFLLITGEPSDSIYMEVELRRLSYLKNTLSPGSNDGQSNAILTHASNARALNHERKMLSKQLLKKFSSKEREALFKKWGIGLKTKQRRLQLCHRLWTDTKDMEHIKESASLVAKLVEMVEPSHAPKEIFGLSLPQSPTLKSSYSWKS